MLLPMPETYALRGTTVDLVKLLVYTAGSPRLIDGQIDGPSRGFGLNKRNWAPTRTAITQQGNVDTVYKHRCSRGERVPALDKPQSTRAAIQCIMHALPCGYCPV